MEPRQPGAPQTLVMKFGGTSVGDAQAIAQAAEIVRQAQEEWPRLVVVTSAMAGVTNLLLDTAAQAVRGRAEAIAQAAQRLRTLHLAAIDALITPPDRQEVLRAEIDQLVSNFTGLCQAVSILGEATPRALDAIAAHGERMSIRLLSAALEVRGIAARPVDAVELIVTDHEFQSAHPDLEATGQRVKQVLSPILDAGIVPVVTGFIGGTPEGITTTLGRGGSDYSAAILGAGLPADEVWIWTDVDGVMSADPRLVKNARTIPELTYREIAELAYFGAKVVHPKTIRPVIEAHIGLRVCNTFNPALDGTRLVADPKPNSTTEKSLGGNGVIKAVTAIRGQSLVTIEGRGMLGIPGVAARAFGSVAATGTSVILITQASSEQSICFAVPLSSTDQVITALVSTFANELAQRDIDRIWNTEEVVIITVVGAGMRNTPGVAGLIFSALGRQNVNVIAIAQGSSEVSISLVVDVADAELAVQTLHDLIVKREELAHGVAPYVAESTVSSPTTR